MVSNKGKGDNGLKPDFDNRIKLPPSRRLRVAVGATVVLLLIGGVAFIYAPEELDHLSDYIIAAVLPLITFILGESFRPSRDSYRDRYSSYDNYNYRDIDDDINQNP